MLHLLLLPESGQLRAYHTQVLHERQAPVEVKAAGPGRGSGVFFTQPHAALDTIFVERPLVAYQDKDSGSQVLACGHCHRALGSIKQRLLQLIESQGEQVNDSSSDDDALPVQQSTGPVQRQQTPQAGASAGPAPDLAAPSSQPATTQNAAFGSSHSTDSQTQQIPALSAVQRGLIIRSLRMWLRRALAVSADTHEAVVCVCLVRTLVRCIAMAAPGPGPVHPQGPIAQSVSPSNISDAAQLWLHQLSSVQVAVREGGLTSVPQTSSGCQGDSDQQQRACQLLCSVADALLALPQASQHHAELVARRRAAWAAVHTVNAPAHATLTGTIGSSVPNGAHAEASDTGASSQHTARVKQPDPHVSSDHADVHTGARGLTPARRMWQTPPAAAAGAGAGRALQPHSALRMLLAAVGELCREQGISITAVQAFLDRTWHMPSVPELQESGVWGRVHQAMWVARARHRRQQAAWARRVVWGRGRSIVGSPRSVLRTPNPDSHSAQQAGQDQTSMDYVSWFHREAQRVDHQGTLCVDNKEMTCGGLRLPRTRIPLSGQTPVPCAYGCGTHYCSTQCREDAWLTHHCLLCPGPSASLTDNTVAQLALPTPPNTILGMRLHRQRLQAFNSFADATNDVFKLVARLVARVATNACRCERDARRARRADHRGAAAPGRARCWCVRGGRGVSYRHAPRKKPAGPQTHSLYTHSQQRGASHADSTPLAPTTAVDTVECDIDSEWEDVSDTVCLANGGTHGNTDSTDSAPRTAQVNHAACAAAAHTGPSPTRLDKALLGLFRVVEACMGTVLPVAGERAKKRARVSGEGPARDAKRSAGLGVAQEEAERVYMPAGSGATLSTTCAQGAGMRAASMNAARGLRRAMHRSSFQPPWLHNVHAPSAVPSQATEPTTTQQSTQQEPSHAASAACEICDDEGRNRALAAAWLPFRAGWKRVWWEAIAVPADVSDPEEFKQQLRELTSDAITLLTRAWPGVAQRWPELFDLNVWGSIIGMFELNNLGLAVPTQMEAYIEAVSELDHPSPAWKQARALAVQWWEEAQEHVSTTVSGSGFFALQSCANHSCLPNAAVRHLPDGSISVYALRPVETGEELTLNYLDESDQPLTYNERKEQLRDYGFTCACERCVRELQAIQQSARRRGAMTKKARK